MLRTLLITSNARHSHLKTINLQNRIKYGETSPFVSLLLGRNVGYDGIG